MIRSLFTFQKSEKNSGPNFSRRKFFGFSLSAVAATVVAVPVVKEVCKLWPHQEEALASLMEYCERDVYAEFCACQMGRNKYGSPNFDHKTARQVGKSWAVATGYGKSRTHHQMMAYAYAARI
jgi:hypothetical protein